MIIEKIQKLIKFLKNKPVQAINNRLDYTALFFIKQVNLAQFIILSAVCTGAIGLIIPHSTINSEKSATKSGVVKLTDWKKPHLQAGSGLLVRSRSTKVAFQSKVKGFIFKIPTRIRKLPVSFIVCYSLSRPEDGLNFRTSLKLYENHGQLSIFEDNKNENISYGLYSNSYFLVKPILPVIHQQGLKSPIYSYVVNVIDAMHRHFMEYYEQFSSGDTQQPEENTDSDNAIPTNLISPPVRNFGLVRTNSRYPMPTESRSNRDDDRSFAKYKAHFLRSIYFKIDVLKTFVFRIEQ